MKRALPNAFDPMPGPLSTRGLLWLVGVVLLGTAVTVHRYLESSEHPTAKPHVEAAEPAAQPTLEVRGAPSRGPRAASLGSVRGGGAGPGGPASSLPSSAGSSAPSSSPSSCFQPTPQ